MINVRMDFENQVDASAKAGTVAIDCKAIGANPNVLIGFAINPSALPNQSNNPIYFTLTLSDANQLANILVDVLNGTPNA